MTLFTFQKHPTIQLISNIINNRMIVSSQQYSHFTNMLPTLQLFFSAIFTFPIYGGTTLQVISTVQIYNKLIIHRQIINYTIVLPAENTLCTNHYIPTV